MQTLSQPVTTATPNTPHLIRGVGLGSATALNMIEMIGIGPFITIPLMISAAGGPQAMLGWILGAVLAMCDGMIWAELGAAMPGSGGSYRYLNQIYGPQKLGRLISFLFIWQLSFTAPMSIASGCIGLSQYAAYLKPWLERVYVAHDLALPIPLLGTLQLSLHISAGTFAAMLACLVAIFLLYRRITSIARVSKVMWVVVMATLTWIIFAGLTHFNAARAFSFPPGAFHLGWPPFPGMGSSMLYAAYLYWGYYSVCFIGGEVKDPGKTIPRALLLSILLVACLYILMSISVLGVIPWQELDATAKSNTGLYTISSFMERIYGPWAAYLVAVLLIFAAFASIFSLMLGYSRVPYAAALDGNYFRLFARVHPKHHFPHVSLIALGVAAMVFCMLKLADVIAALVVIRITLQFLIQAIGVMVLRIQRPDMPRPFRMWLYPLPALIATVGFIYIVVSRTDSMKQFRYAVVLLVTGLVIYFIRAWRNGEWPFGQVFPVVAEETAGN